MPENELMREIRKMCDARGLIVNHWEDSVGGRPWINGTPDLLIIGRDILHVEAKREEDTPSPDQRRIGHAIDRAGGRFYVWRPSQLLDGTIERALDELA